MVIENNIVKRDSLLCIDDLCLKINLIDEIISVYGNGASVLLLSDNGEYEYLTLLSTHPTVILMKALAEGRVEIDEYKLRE
jgi:hypothetical protein